MAENRKILGQVSPQAATDTVLYSCAVPAIVSTIFACNTNGATRTVRIWVRRNNEATETKQYLYYDLTLLTTDTLACTAGVTLAVGDVLMVRASGSDVAFSAFGMEGT